jgi:hypothetical protein
MTNFHHLKVPAGCKRHATRKFTPVSWPTSIPICTRFVPPGKFMKPLTPAGYEREVFGCIWGQATFLNKTRPSRSALGRFLALLFVRGSCWLAFAARFIANRSAIQPMLTVVFSRIIRPRSAFLASLRFKSQASPPSTRQLASTIAW